MEDGWNVHVEWDCPKCGTHNHDDYFEQVRPLCEGCFEWIDWEDALKGEALEDANRRLTEWIAANRVSS